MSSLNQTLRDWVCEGASLSAFQWEREADKNALLKKLTFVNAVPSWKTPVKDLLYDYELLG